MPRRPPIPEPNIGEEKRQIAESVADLYYTMSTIKENAKEFIPGEAVEEFEVAWDESELSMRQLISSLIPELVNPIPRPNPPSMIDPIFPLPNPDQIIRPDALERHQLIGKVGKIKRNTLARFKDCFFMLWNSSSLPHTEETIEKARKAAVEYLDFGAIFVSSIPGYEQVEELLSLGKKLVEFRIKRGT
jgi:hypothetical protein